MILGGLHAASLGPSWLSFLRAAHSPAVQQQTRLREIVGLYRGCAYAQAFELSDEVRRFQDAVPIVRYDDIVEFVARAASGEARIFTREPIEFFERTSGSTAHNKLIPFTRSGLREVSAATSPWLFDLYRSHPTLLNTRSYWAISPAARAEKRTVGGQRIGAPSDRSYFGAVGRWALGRLMAVDDSVGQIEDMELWAEETCRQLRAAKDLGLISVWSPTFLALLLDRLADEIHELWPRLALVSCWTDGESKVYAEALRARLQGVPIQPKGLLATEGVVTIPIDGVEGAVAAVGGHFLEFRDEERPQARPRLVHELAVGGTYSPILTTSNGLLRYHLPDLVECVGFWYALPRLRFKGRLDRTSDLVGEKLEPAFVDEAVRQIEVPHDFALLTPQHDHYVLYLDTAAPAPALQGAAQTVEHALRQSVSYAYCRALGQLGPVKARRVKDGKRLYQEALLNRGCRLGDIKPTLIDGRMNWSEVFSP